MFIYIYIKTTSKKQTHMHNVTINFVEQLNLCIIYVFGYSFNKQLFTHMLI